MKARHPWRLAVISVAAAACLPALAQEHHRGEERREHETFRAHAPAPARPLQLDGRYGHDHYYPAHGTVVPVLPTGSVSVGFHGSSWYFHGGVWFRPEGGRFVVGAPPFGIVVPLLPPACVTVWIGGLAYYYANGVYYSSAPGGYVVVEPPPGAATAQAVPPAPPMPDPVIYPRNGQSATQMESDRQDCNRWATAQPGALASASVFQRATAACMDGRGYTVR